MKSKGEYLVMVLCQFAVVGMAIVVWTLFFADKNKAPVIQELKINVKVENGMVLNMEATGYAMGAPYSSLTKSGEWVVGKGFLKVGDLDVFTIASDPKVLKLGSIVYIDGLGLGMVTDTGSKVNGLKIDICFKTIQEARNFGKKKVKVFILKN